MPQPDEKTVRKKAEEILKQGIGKQTAYEQLIEEFGHPTSTAKVLKQIPSKQAWKKFGIWNHILSGLMTLLFLMLFLPNPSIGTLIWYGLPTVAVLMRKTRFYFWVVILAIIGTIVITALTISLSGNIHTNGIIKISIFFAILLPAAFLSVWLPKKLTPEPIEEREFYENEYGEQRSRIVYKFKE